MPIFLFLVLAQWQQRVSYDIHADLNTEKHTLAATVDLNYWNNSPHTLDTLYLHLNTEAFRFGFGYYAREATEMGDTRFAKMPQEAYGGITIYSVECNSNALTFNITETILTIPLRQPVAGGDSLSIKINFSVRIPRELREFGCWPGHYEMTHWYPMICVFDAEGWHLDPIYPLGGAHREFGDYDVTIDLPAGYIVAGTGRQIDLAENEFRDSLIISDKGPHRNERKKVRFLAENVSDFAWVCDSVFTVSEYNIDGMIIRVFCRQGNEKGFRNAGMYAQDVLARYRKWFGPYAYDNFSIVDGYYQHGVIFPQMVILNSAEDPFSRFFEVSVAAEIGYQYFNACIGTNGTDESWFGKGLSTYAAIRYMEDKYGRDNSLIKTSLVPPLSLRYLHRLHYYVIQTNQLERPVSTPTSSYDDNSVVYFNSTHSKPALFLFSLENFIDRKVFEGILQRYCQEHKFKHARSRDFVAMCEGVSNHELTSLFDSFLNTAEFCDWSVSRVTEHAVEIENKGDLDIPVRVHVQTEYAEHVFSLDAQEKRYVIDVPRDSGKVINVMIDSSESTLDPDYWNNYFPRKVSVKPVFDFDWPSFSTYQILWTPYLWYDSYDGVKAGLYLFGDNFADFDFVRGGYQVTAGYTYGFKSGRHYPTLNYQTPVLFEEGKRVRIRFSGSRSRGGDKVSIGISSNLGRPFTRKPQMSITNKLTYNDLSTYSGLDSIDWDLGRNIVFENGLKFRYSDLSVDVGLSSAHHALGSEWEYLKMTIEAQRSFAFAVPFSARLFVGKIFGEAPAHERLFLSGALRTNLLSSLLFGQSGKYSPQERVHIPGDGNMRGYQTLHIKSPQMYVLNLEFPTRTLIRVFTDIGYYDKFAFDVGVRLAIGSETFPFLPLYGVSISANFPLYSYIEGEPWKFRWSFGFSL